MKKFTLVLFLMLFTAGFCFAQERSLVFDGVDDIVTGDPAAVNGLESFTIEFWMKAGVGGADRDGFVGMMDSGAGDHLFAMVYNYNTGNFNVNIMGQAFGPHAFALAADTWYHVAVTFDYATGQAVFYLDGTVLYSGTLAGYATLTTVDTFLLGQQGLGAFFLGTMNEFRVWNGVRSQSDIQGYMGYEANGSENGLLVCYQFNEGSGQVVGDATAFGYDGTLGADGAAGGDDPAWTNSVPALDALTFYSNTYYRGWTLMSWPFQLPGTPSVHAMYFDDIIGLYQVIGFTSATGYYFPDVVETGEAYWLAIAFDEEVDLDGLGVEFNGPYVRDLDWGWNFMGYPFETPSSIFDWQISHNGNTYTMIEAILNDMVVPVLHTSFAPLNWDPAQDPAGPWIPFFQTTDAYPWLGYWFLTVVDGLTLTIPDPTPAPPAPDATDEVTEEAWRVSLLAHSGEAFAGASFGANEAATGGYDMRFDWPAAPGAPEGNLALTFDRAGWDNPNGDDFASDIVAPLEGPHQYTLELTGTGSIELRWSDLDVTAPASYGFELLVDGSSYDMREVDMVTVNGASQLTVLVTPDAVDVDEGVSANLPAEFALEAAYPNPFNPSTTLNYTLPRSSHVSLAVYDVMGREVAELQKGTLQPGRHQVSWNAADHASGIYFVRMQAEGFSAMQKVILMK